ncbi:class A beta-lactamase-related serine hydrolase [Hymenobacter sp. 15J16-1T3B]|uniref:serine hydrolase n=1 Tax=Hymenobacter sp. 15J16-1T3B TaxID=2886941 RepID=UPI001D0FBA91|nr:serine hydrolase [Hymenobacter sp. 15J16-1T3B]MCC3157530.1 class A beta-lactamase-related serine hydrolase [Hymenobacter sp. 15J16-1T3B]
MRRFFALALLLSAAPPAAQAQLANPLKQLLRRDTAAVMRQVLHNPAAYRLQIVYTQIQRDEQGRSSFKSFTYRLRPKEYFYPASTVKLPTVAAALQKLQRLHLEREMPLRIDSTFAGQTRVLLDSTAPGRRPTIGQYVRKILLVSDNDAFNRLYEFVGQAELNQDLRHWGLPGTRIIHRLSVGDKEPGSRHTNSFTFFADSTGAAVRYQQPAAFNDAPLPVLPAVAPRVGRAYLSGEQRIEQPLDFSDKNFFPLAEQQQVLRALLFPQFVPATQRFDLAAADYAFLRKYLRLPPRQSRYPRYDAAHYPDNYAKFLLVGGPPAALPEGVRIYNKIGQAYGFLIDNACIVDSLRGVEFLLSAVVYCNEDEVLNDDHYDYDTVGLPFLRRLGQLVYQYELTRTDERRRQQVRTYWAAQQERAEP